MMRTAVTSTLILAGLAAGCAMEDDPPTADDIESQLSLQEFHGRFGSPTIARDGDTLHAYFAIQSFEGHTVHVAHARSNDDGKTWLRVGDALPKLNKRAAANSTVWAPGIARIDDHHWMLYYTAQEAGTTQHMCIFRAHAANAHGPFVDDFEGPLVCQSDSHWSIDPYPVRDAHGDWHLLARIDEGDGVNTISIRKLGELGRHFADGSQWVTLTRINKGGWEEPVMENAAIVRLDAGSEKHWYVFYSGGSYRNNSYAVGYADCGTSINGPCEKKTVGKPWLASRPELHMFGPGTPTFYKDANGDTIMAVNTWKFSGGQSNPKNHGQIMHLFKVTIGADGKPNATFVRMVE
jgi:hypothetical protein